MVAPGHRIRALCLDVMGTLVEPIKPRDEFVSSIYLPFLESASPEELFRAIRKARKKHLQALYTDSRSRWIAINRAVLQSLGKQDVREEEAAQIHDAFTSDPSAYEVKPDMRQFLEWASARITLALISNQPRELIELFLHHHGVASYFGNRIVSAWEVRRWKPSLGFFRRAANELRYHPSELIHIGNSIQHDLPGAKVVRTILIVRGGSMPTRGASVRPLVQSGMLSSARGPLGVQRILERQRFVCGRDESRRLTPKPRATACGRG